MAPNDENATLCFSGTVMTLGLSSTVEHAHFSNKSSQLEQLIRQQVLNLDQVNICERTSSHQSVDGVSRVRSVSHQTHIIVVGGWRLPLKTALSVSATKSVSLSTLAWIIKTVTRKTKGCWSAVSELCQSGLLHEVAKKVSCKSP